MIAFERDVEAIAQDVLGVALVNSEARQFRLVDQNPSHVAPEETGKRAMRVRLPVGELMVPAVDSHPACGGFLEAGHRDDHHRVLQPFRTCQAAMGQKPVIAKVDAKQPAQMGAEHGDDEAAPTAARRRAALAAHSLRQQWHDPQRAAPRSLQRGGGLSASRVGNPNLCARRSLQLNRLIHGYPIESRTGCKPLTEFAYFVYPSADGSVVAVSRTPRSCSAWIDI